MSYIPQKCEIWAVESFYIVLYITYINVYIVGKYGMIDRQRNSQALLYIFYSNVLYLHYFRKYFMNCF